VGQLHLPPSDVPTSRVKGCCQAALECWRMLADPTIHWARYQPGYDFPRTIEDQLHWMTKAGFCPEVIWVPGSCSSEGQTTRNVGASPRGCRPEGNRSRPTSMTSTARFVEEGRDP
jgi:hypothetical protein